MTLLCTDLPWISFSSRVVVWPLNLQNSNSLFISWGPQITMKCDPFHAGKVLTPLYFVSSVNSHWIGTSWFIFGFPRESITILAKPIRWRYYRIEFYGHIGCLDGMDVVMVLFGSFSCLILPTGPLSILFAYFPCQQCFWDVLEGALLVFRMSGNFLAHTPPFWRVNAFLCR